jgi:DNA-binding SARP family transcriptional activator/Tfp pilus assembly protein PilF
MVELRTLGSLSLQDAGGRELQSLLTQPKRFALLAYLAVASPRGFHRRDTLLAFFWPELNPGRARNALRQAIHVLREPLPAGVLINRGDDEIGLDWSRITCDVAEFENALTEGDGLRAMDLYRGDLLEGFHLSDAPGFERWLDEERGRLRTQAADAAWALAAGEEAEYHLVGAAHWARLAAALQPDDENASQRLITLLDRLGDRSGAIHTYEVLAHRLRKEYDVEPSPETQELIEAVRARETSDSPVHKQDGSHGAPQAPMGITDASNKPQALRPRRKSAGRRVVAVATMLAGAGAIAYWLPAAGIIPDRRPTSAEGGTTANVAAGARIERARQILNGRRTPEDLKFAAQLAREALDLDSSFAPAWALLGVIHIQNGSRDRTESLWLDSAAQAVTTALAIDPNHHMVHNANGALQFTKGNWAEALAAYLRALELDRDYPPTLANIASIYGRVEAHLDAPGRSSRWSSRLRNLDARRGIEYTGRGDGYWQSGEYDEAEEWYLKALGLNPNNLYSLRRMTELYLTQGRIEDARIYVERAVRLNTHSPDAIPLVAGLVEIFAADYEKAKIYFENAINTDPPLKFTPYSGISATTALGYIYWKSADTARALEFFDRSTQLNEAHLQGGHWAGHAPYDMARIEAIQGNTDAANRWLRRAIDEWHWSFVYTHLGPRDPMLENLRGDPTFQGMMAEVRAKVDREAAESPEIEEPPTDEEFREMIAQAWVDVERLSALPR